MFRALGYILASIAQRRALEAQIRAMQPRVVWRKTSIPAVPRKAR